MGRLREKTPSRFNGLYTDGLETCIAIVIAGSGGITLIHDTGMLSFEMIATEFQSLGD